MDNSKITVILLFPDIEINSTSVNRYNSIIQELSNQKFNVKIISFIYPWDKSNIAGNEITQVDEIEYFISQNLYLIKSKLNSLQKLAFRLLRNSKLPFWKVANYLHQIIFKKDIFYPGNLSIKDLELGNITEIGYVVTSGGPFGIFSFANKIASESKFKLILDYRDPWTFGYPALNVNPFIHKLKVIFSRRTEYRILEKSELIITVSKTLKNFFPIEFQEKIRVFENGSNFNIEEISFSTLTESFNIVYAGTVYDIQLQDETFFKAFSDFVKHKDKYKIKLFFLGSDHNKLLKEIIEKYNLAQFCEITKRKKRSDMLELLNIASIFLHLKYGDNGNIITSKQADYLVFKRPILLPMNDFGDLEKSITTTKSGTICNSKSEIIDFLEFHFSKFLKDENLIIENDFQPESRNEIAKKIIKNLK